MFFVNQAFEQWHRDLGVSKLEELDQQAFVTGPVQLEITEQTARFRPELLRAHVYELEE